MEKSFNKKLQNFIARWLDGCPFNKITNWYLNYQLSLLHWPTI